MSEYTEIIKALEKGKGLTCMEAIRLGITINLRSRIPELIERGYDIHTVMEPHKTENGTRNHARYFLVKSGASNEARF